MNVFDSLRLRRLRYRTRRHSQFISSEPRKGFGHFRKSIQYTIAIFAIVSPISVFADNWRSVSTEHFKIVYSADDPFAVSAAAEVMALAPSVWKKATSYMRYTPTKRITVVLRSHTAHANGLYTPNPPHIELYISAPSRYDLGSRTPNWLELAFVHETIHYLHLNQPKGFFGVASRIFGPLTNAYRTIFLPGWAVEGPTVYGETLLTPGGRGTDPFFEMTWLAPIYADEFYSYNQASYNSPFPPRGRIYSAGYLMVDYLHRIYGADVYHAINDSFMRRPVGGMDRAVRKIIGNHTSSIFMDMVTERKNRSAERFVLEEGTAVSPTDIVADWHLIGTTDAGILAWSGGRARTPGAVYLLDADDAFPPRSLFPISPTDASSVAVDSDLSRAIAAIVHVDLAGSGGSYSDLHIIDLSPDSPPRSRRITRNRQLLHPTFIPNSEAAVAVERQGQYSRLVRVAIDTGEITPIYEPRSVRLHAPQVSPDGAVIAVVEHHEGSQDIVIVSVRTGAVVARLATPEHHEFDPRFITNSAPYHIAYGSDEPGYLIVKEVSFTPGDSPQDVRGTTVIRDPIAAYSAIRHGDYYVYQTYRANGHAIRKQPVARTTPTESGAIAIPITTSSVATAAENPPPGTLPIDDVRYIDHPRPVFWFPTAAISGGVDKNPVFQLGIYALASSVLGRHNVTLSANYDPSTMGPVGSLTYAFQPRATTWSAAVSRTLEEDEDDDRYFPGHTFSLDAERWLWYRDSIDRSRDLKGAVGTIYEEEDEERRMTLRGTLQFFRTRNSASGLFHGSSNSTIIPRVSVTPRILDQSNVEIATQTQFSQSWQIGQSRLYFKPNVTVTSSRTKDAIDSIPFASQSRFDEDGNNAIVSAPNALLGNVTIGIDLGPYDAAYRTLASTGSSLSLFVEQVAVPGKATVADITEGEDDDDQQISWRTLRSDNYTILGTAFSANLLFNWLPIRLTGGISLRIPHLGSEGTPNMQYFFSFGNPDTGTIQVKQGSWTDRF